MKTHTVFTLLDGSRHDTIEKAKEHCLEQMGAETRDMLQSILDSRPAMVYTASLNLVAHKKYDQAIMLYVQWRKEHDALELYEKGADDE